MSLEIYGLKKCSTCQKALAWLDEQKIDYQFTDYKETPLKKNQVAHWSKALGGWEKLINRAGYTWRGLADSERDNLTEAKAEELAIAHPSLIRRPLIVYPDGRVTVGFSAKVREGLT